MTFQLDVNGLLSVSAREETTGIEQSIKIEGASTLSRDEVTTMIKEAEKNASADKSKKSIVNITYELDNLFFRSENFLKKLSISPTTKNLLEELFKEIAEAYQSNKITEIKDDLLDFVRDIILLSLSDSFSSTLRKNTKNSWN